MAAGAERPVPGIRARVPVPCRKTPAGAGVPGRCGRIPASRHVYGRIWELPARLVLPPAVAFPVKGRPADGRAVSA